MTVKTEQSKNIEKTILSSFVYIELARKNIVPSLEKVLSMTDKQRKIFLARLLKKNSKLFTEMYNPVIEGVLNSYNLSNRGYNRFYSRYGRMNKYIPVKALPKTDPFKITEKYLRKSSIVKRGLINSRDLNEIIKKGVKNGWDYKKTGREIEFKLGYRDKKTGKLTKGIPKNGIHYQTSTIARQESRRANGIAMFDQYKEAVNSGIDTRLRMIARLKSTSREQSAIMNGQLDGEPYGSKGNGTFNKEYQGLFQYPDRGWYKFSEAPIQYSINDREYIIPIIIGNKSQEVANNQAEIQNKKAKKLDLQNT